MLPGIRRFQVRHIKLESNTSFASMERSNASGGWSWSAGEKAGQESGDFTPSTVDALFQVSDRRQSRSTEF
jgi:hypothetical protein